MFLTSLARNSGAGGLLDQTANCQVLLFLRPWSSSSSMICVVPELRLFFYCGPFFIGPMPSVLRPATWRPLWDNT